VPPRLVIAEHAAASDQGRRRSQNEDAVLVRPPVFAVADGMGGAPAGDLASEVAVSALWDATAETLADRATAAHRRILALAAEDPDRLGMGSTLTAAALGAGGVRIVHVGDSRAYRLRDGVLDQLTQDHALAAELAAAGTIDQERAARHPARSAVTRALGQEEGFCVDVLDEEARAGDVYVLCSDGLTRMVGDEELAAIIGAAATLSVAARNLVAAANEHGGRDNVSVALFRLGAEGATGG
jgi:serine/threonine protein phosphatase PrpC